MSRTFRPRAGFPSLRKRILVILAAAAILALAGRSLLGDRGMFEVWRKKSAYQQLAAEVQDLREENVSLQQEVRDLRTDPLAIERIAREELGYSRPGEITFVFREDETPRPEVRP